MLVSTEYASVHSSAQIRCGGSLSKSDCHKSPTYTSVKAILKNNMDRLPDTPISPQYRQYNTQNVRGSKLLILVQVAGKLRR